MKETEKQMYQEISLILLLKELAEEYFRKMNAEVDNIWAILLACKLERMK
jgi:hypothetical protein